jgi:hypothetical protein
MEKVISEVKMIETDDGYRIEIKGDKEQIKASMKGFHRRRKRGRRGFPGMGGPCGHGGFGMHPFMMKMASGHGPWDFEDDEEDSADSE